MSLGIFEFKFGKNPREFNSVEEIDKFVEEKIGHKLKLCTKFSDIVSNRGSIIPLKDVDADKIFEVALKK